MTQKMPAIGDPLMCYGQRAVIRDVRLGTNEVLFEAETPNPIFEAGVQRLSELVWHAGAGCFYVPGKGFEPPSGLRMPVTPGEG